MTDETDTQPEAPEPKVRNRKFNVCATWTNAAGSTCTRDAALMAPTMAAAIEAAEADILAQEGDVTDLVVQAMTKTKKAMTAADE